MSKRYLKIINSCWECPALDVDQNGCKWLCRQSKGKFICWHGNELEKKDYFPEWCPLPESETFNEEDFNV